MGALILFGLLFSAYVALLFFLTMMDSDHGDLMAEIRRCFHYRKIGGIRFLRFAGFQFSVCRPTGKPKRLATRKRTSKASATHWPLGSHPAPRLTPPRHEESR